MAISTKKAKYDCIVVGGGPNGLAAAITLAQASRSVLLLEANKEVGGGARSANLTKPGFVHDVCSAIHPLGVGSPFFRTLPLEEHGLQWIQPPAPLAHPFDDGTAVVVERSVKQTCVTLENDHDAKAYGNLMRPIIHSWEKLEKDLLAPMLHIPKHPLEMMLFGANALMPAATLAKMQFKGMRARGLLAGLAAHSILPLESLASASFALVLGALAHHVGWPLPKGGSQKISDALASLFTSLGGEIVTGRRVDSLQELPYAKAILLDLTPRQVVNICSERLPASYQRRLSRFKYGPGVFKMDWALNGPIPWKAHGCTRAATVHLGASLDEISDSEKAVWDDEVARRPFVLLAQPSLFDDSRAPAGKHTAWAYCHVPNGYSKDVAGRIEGQIERFAPGFRQTILARSMRGPHEMQRDNENYVGGDISGGSNQFLQLLARPTLSGNPYATAVPGLYICSASTPPGAGVHGMCGYYAAKAALRQVFRL